MMCGAVDIAAAPCSGEMIVNATVATYAFSFFSFLSFCFSLFF
jgi:hypothetical protein